MAEPRADPYSGDEEDVDDDIVTEFRSLISQSSITTTSRSRRITALNPEAAEVLKTCLCDLDKQKDVMLDTVKIELTKALYNARESEQRLGDEQQHAEDFQHDVHALVEVLSAAFHSGQWKFGSSDFRTVTDDMLPPAGSSSKEGMRVSWLEKQLTERGRKIQGLQQELVSSSARHRVLQEQVAQRDSDLMDLRHTLSSNQERLSAGQRELERVDQEGGQRHSVLMDEVKQRDNLLDTLKSDHAKLQHQHDSTVKSLLATGDEVNRLRQEVQAEKARSTQLGGDLTTSQQTAENLSQQLAKQEAQVESLLQRLNAQISDLQSNVDVVESKYKKACTETEAARTELDDCTLSLQNTQADATMYHDQLLDSRAKVEQWESSVQLMRKEHVTEISRREKTIQDLEMKLQVADTERDCLSQDLSHRAKTIHALEEDCRAKTVRYKWQMTMKRLILEQLRYQHHSEVVCRQGCEEKLASCAAASAMNSSQLQATQSELEQTNTTLSNTQDDFTNSLEQFHSDKKSTDATIQELQTRLATLNVQLETSGKNVMDLEEGNAQLQGALASSQSALAACQEQLTEETETTDILREELESCKSDCSKACGDRDSLSEEIQARDELVSELRHALATAGQSSVNQARQHKAAYDELLQLQRNTSERLQLALDEVNGKSENLTSLWAQAKQLEAEKRTLQEKFDKCSQDLGVAQVEVETSREENKLCQKQIVKMEDEQGSLKGVLSDARGELEHKNQQIAVLVESEEAFRASVEKLKERLQATEELEFAKMELEGEVDRVEADLALANKTLEAKEKSFEEVSATSVELEADRARLADMVSGRDQELSRLRQAQESDSGRGEQVETLEVQLLDLKEELSTLNGSLLRSQDETEEWKSTCKSNESNSNRFKAECDRVRKLLVLKSEELQTAKDQVAEVEREQRRLLQEAQSEKDCAVHLQTELDLLRHRRSDVEESLMRELESLRCSSNYMATADRLSAELDEANREVMQLRKSLASAEGEHDGIVSKLRVSQDAYGKLEVRAKAAENAAQRARDEADSSMSATQDEEMEIRQVKQTNEVLSAELSQRQSVIDVLRRDIDDLKVEFRTSSHELKLKRLRLRQLEQDLEAQRIQNTTLKEKVMAHERQQTLLTIALERSQEERAGLSGKINELITMSSQPHDHSVLTTKAKALDKQVSELTSALNSTNSLLRHFQRLHDDALANLEGCERKREAETSVLEREVENLRAKEDNADGTHQQLVGQLQATIGTLEMQLDKVTLQHSCNGTDADGYVNIDGGDDDVDMDESSHGRSGSFSAALLRDVTVTQLEAKCGNLQSEVSAAKRLNSSMQLREQQRQDRDRDRFEQERSKLRQTLAETEQELVKTKQASLAREQKIIQLTSSLERAERERSDTLHKVSSIQASLDALNARKKLGSGNASF